MRVLARVLLALFAAALLPYILSNSATFTLDLSVKLTINGYTILLTEILINE